ncbi:MAG: NADH-dependent dehydrogenase [Gemmatales bacterium]|nr:MAG: NADH-dependent dehydrogenase [Gemmatales bacterium]
MPLRMAVVGVGHLGKEHARILSDMPGVELTAVVDCRLDQARMVADRCRTRAVTHFRDVLADIDAAVVAVPTCHHYVVATELLDAGVHLLIEKPIAATLDEAERLVQQAKQKQLILQVGHVERFNPAFEELMKLPLQPKFIECRRYGHFTGRSIDIGCVMDLMIHDLDLVLALVRAPVRSVDALGMAPFNEHEEVANARLHFANGCVASLSASRLTLAPQRTLHVWGPEGFAGVDLAQRQLTLVQPSRILRERGLKPATLDAAARARLKNELFQQYFDVYHGDHNFGDQLTRELENFVASVRTRTRPRVSGEDGRDALALAETILESIRQHAWNGTADGPVGPNDLPRPLGVLFHPIDSAAA